MADEAAPTPVALAEPVESKPVARYGIRHDPAVIAAVGDAIERGLTGEQAATLVGVSPCSIERIVAESEDLRSLRARAREAKAEALVTEALTIVDAPIVDPETASAEMTRARNRAEFRKWLASRYNRDLYDDRAPVVAVQVTTNVVSAFDKLGGRIEGEG